ncbi:phage head morphogenesis protein [Marinococcus luteus]|uniref:phage head morphogenesis protein n=1 Tax=Marinococcus luteus TaxID=1122204 RepID=UPI002ACCBCCE|nr:phage minor head protein [Marinococcus luteus]MDZ5782102.1 phage minor head protein [Marinococcus luteus]
MKQSTASQMLAPVKKFLVYHCELPAFTKGDQMVEDAEEALQNKLNRLQDGLEAMFIQVIRDEGILPSDVDAQRAIVARVLDEPFENMKETIADDSVEVAELGRQMAFDDFRSFGIDFSSTDFSEEVRDQLRNQVYEFSTDTFERIQGDFQETLAKGYADGKGIDDIADDLSKDFRSLRESRLALIARNEVQGAQNEGSHRTMEEYEIEYEQWLSVGDTRVRDTNEASHVDMHGEVVEVGEDFSNGLRYPGDRRGAKAEYMNCRCRARPYIPREDEHITSTPYYP